MHCLNCLRPGELDQVFYVGDRSKMQIYPNSTEDVKSAIQIAIDANYNDDGFATRVSLQYGSDVVARKFVVLTVVAAFVVEVQSESRIDCL